ncbi:MAG TPA: hypothetical protein DC054_20720 [Blastocatellia bacterium]|nr:hypothetical protein [Blastocatellia bacterium]
MFCPSCGTESTIELNYCNRCGANLSTPPVSTTEWAPISLTKPIAIIGAVVLFITLGGFAGVLSAASEIARSGSGNAKDLPMAITFFGMITILTLDILLIRQLSKLISAALSPNRLATKKQPAPLQNELRYSRPATARLDPAPSVTENTTRFLDTYAPAPVAEPVPAKKTDR